MAKAKPYDAAHYLDSDEMIEAYLADAFDEGDAAGITIAIGNVARARSMSTLAQQTGLSREALYRSLSLDGNPAFSTIVKVMDVWGMQIGFTPKKRPVETT